MLFRTSGWCTRTPSLVMSQLTVVQTVHFSATIKYQMKQKEMPCSSSLQTPISNPVNLVLSPSPIYVPAEESTSFCVDHGSVHEGACVWVCGDNTEDGREQQGVRPWSEVTLPSAGPWSPDPPGGWWRCSSPTPLSAAPGAMPPPLPAPSSPRKGASGVCGCPPMPSYWGSAACPAEKDTIRELAFFYFSFFYLRNIWIKQKWPTPASQSWRPACLRCVSFGA